MLQIPSDLRCKYFSLCRIIVAKFEVVVTKLCMRDKFEKFVAFSLDFSRVTETFAHHLVHTTLTMYYITNADSNLSNKYHN